MMSQGLTLLPGGSADPRPGSTWGLTLLLDSEKVARFHVNEASIFLPKENLLMAKKHNLGHNEGRKSKAETLETLREKSKF